MKQNLFKGKCKITKVDVTDDTITGREGRIHSTGRY